MEQADKKIFLTRLDKERSLLLKFCVFATGLSGIVSEYVLSTLATYLIGNPVLQWSMVISIMLFAMGVGSRLSKLIVSHLLEIFILTEFSISFLCSASAAAGYFSSLYTIHTGLIIYFFSFVIGLLIGFEIPLITRINSYYEELRTNIADVLEKDYLGALAGGLLFAFVALPYLGLTYTPIVLGLVNFSVASLLLFRLKKSILFFKVVFISFIFVLISILLLLLFIKPIVLYGEQRKYKDTIIFEKQTRFQKIVITRWKNDYWLYINGNEQFSSYDEKLYHEPLVHPAMALLKEKKKVLILGGGDGLALREVLKYRDVEKVVLVDIDPEMTSLAMKHPVLLNLNNDALNDPKVEIVNQDAYNFLSASEEYYDLILADLPDPNTLDLNMLYSVEFYMLARKHLTYRGILVTQATSPMFSKRAFLCILKSIKQAGFASLPYHNHVPTMGEVGWVLGMNLSYLYTDQLKRAVQSIDTSDVKTEFLNREAMVSMINFSKNAFSEIESLEVNSKLNPVLYRYYNEGKWDIY